MWDSSVFFFVDGAIFESKIGWEMTYFSLKFIWYAKPVEYPPLTYGRICLALAITS